jgi:hypothetical protein
MSLYIGVNTNKINTQAFHMNLNVDQIKINLTDKFQITAGFLFKN